MAEIIADDGIDLAGLGVVFDARTREILAKCGYRLHRARQESSGDPHSELKVDLPIDVADLAAHDHRTLTLQLEDGAYQSFQVSTSDPTSGSIAVSPKGPLRSEWAEDAPTKDPGKH